MYRLIYIIPFLLLMFAIKFVCIILGHIIVPPLLAYGLYIKKRTKVWPWVKYSWRYKQYYNGFPDWAYLWANEGDGVLGPPEYTARYPNWSEFRRAWTWTANRNPANNLRFIRGYSLNIDPDRVRFIGSLGPEPLQYDTPQPFALLTWHSGSPHAGILCYYRSPINNRLTKFLFGYKIYAKDKYGFTIPYRQFGAGFGAQWKYID